MKCVNCGKQSLERLCLICEKIAFDSIMDDLAEVGT